MATHAAEMIIRARTIFRFGLLPLHLRPLPFAFGPFRFGLAVGRVILLSRMYLFSVRIYGITS
jgi:hypothetical protein